MFGGVILYACTGRCDWSRKRSAVEGGAMSSRLEFGGWGGGGVGKEREVGN